MSHFDIKQLLDACHVHKQHRHELETLSLHKVKIQKQSKTMIFYIDNPKMLSLSAYQELKRKLKRYFHQDVVIEMMQQHTLSDIKQASAWLKYVLSTFRISKVPLLKIVESEIQLLVEDDEWHMYFNEQKPMLEAKLNALGFTHSIRCVRVEKSNDVKAVQYQPQVKRPAKTSTTYTNKRNSEPPQAMVISQLEEAMQNVIVKGYIVSLETKKINRTQIIQSFVLTDLKDAISAKRFLTLKQAEKDENALFENAYVACVGNVQFDRFKREIGLVVRSVDIIEATPLMHDDAPEKRIEFHAHTKMSEMDGVSDVSELIEQALAYGHKALAITDHFNVQAFPKAETSLKRLSKKYNVDDFKMIYGVEMNMIEDRPLIVTHPNLTNLDDLEYIIFDIETTGLSADFDYMIEFGAIRVKHQQIIDEFTTFIKPPAAIPAFITQKTNITQTHVENAPQLRDVIDQIEAFIQDGVLVAHNAKFDVGFLNQAFARHGKQPIVQPVIDTLELSRVLLVERKSFKLGRVARAFSIAYDEEVAHRADYDVAITNQVFQHLMALAKAQDVTTLFELSELNHPDSFKNMMKHHVQVLAKNQKGLTDLFRLVSISHMDTLAFYKKANNKREEDEFMAEPRIKRSALKQYRDNLLIGAGCFNSEVFEVAAFNQQSDLERVIQFYDYVEIQPLGHYQPLVEQNLILDQARLKAIVLKIVECAQAHKIPVIATGDVHFVFEKDKIFRDIMISAQGIGGVRHPLYYYDEYKRLTTASPNQYFMNTATMLKEFNYLGESLAHELVIENPKRLAAQIAPLTIIKEELFTPQIDHADDNLKTIVYEHAYQKYGNPLPHFIEARIHKELHAITTNGFGVIYYIAHLLVKKSLDDGYLVGSRGSVGSSLVAHLANITEVNPLPPHYVCPQCKASEFIDDGSVGSGFDLPPKQCVTCQVDLDVDGQDIPFETFLGFDGDKVPDIDLNFSNQYQEFAHAYTKELFGEESVYRAGTIGTIAEKTAYGYAKGYGEEMKLPADIKDARWSWYASGVTGVKRTTGQHPGGIIVIPNDMEIYEFTPVQFPANNTDSPWKTTHFEFADIHDNLLKLDLLGHLDPSAMKMLQEITGIDPTTIKMNDTKVMSIFSSINALNVDARYTSETTGAIGLPEFGTSFVRDILKITQPKNFSDLVRISGLSHGTNIWLNNAKDLIEKQHLTLSDVIGCRDDIMVYLIHKGLKPKEAFDIMESVRRGRGLTDAWVTLMKQHDIDDWYIDSCQKIEYMFPKAHAVAYVIMAVRVAWFKVYYPLAYYSTFFTLRANAFDVDVMLGDVSSVINKLSDINRRLNDPSEKFLVTNKERELYNTLEVVLEMKLRGYHFSNIDLYRSQAVEFKVDEQEPNAILLPFVVLDTLGANVANSIVAARDTSFLSKEDLVNRTALNYNHIKKLDSLGVLDDLQEENQCSLFDDSFFG